MFQGKKRTDAAIDFSCIMPGDAVLLVR